MGHPQRDGTTDSADQTLAPSTATEPPNGDADARYRESISLLLGDERFCRLLVAEIVQGPCFREAFAEAITADPKLAKMLRGKRGERGQQGPPGREGGSTGERPTRGDESLTRPRTLGNCLSPEARAEHCAEIKAIMKARNPNLVFKSDKVQVGNEDGKKGDPEKCG